MTVLDPFLGIGHAAVAAATVGVRRFVGYDIDSEYLRTAEEKLGLDGGAKERMKRTMNYPWDCEFRALFEEM